MNRKTIKNPGDDMVAGIAGILGLMDIIGDPHSWFP